MSRSHQHLFIVFLTLLFIAIFPPICSALGTDQTKQEQFYIYIDLWHNELLLFKKGKLEAKFKIAPGKNETPTPVGHFKVISKSKDWGTGFGTRWLGLDVPWGTYGIHGTNKPNLIGQNVSAGCVRMRNRDVEKLYELVPVGTPVHIDGPLNRLFDGTGLYPFGTGGITAARETFKQFCFSIFGRPAPICLTLPVVG